MLICKRKENNSNKLSHISEGMPWKPTKNTTKLNLIYGKCTRKKLKITNNPKRKTKTKT